MFPDEMAVTIHFYVKHRYLPRIHNPVTFSEKIQNRKLYGEIDRYRKFVDKLEVKKYVSEIVGEKYAVETIWSGKKLPSLEERGWRVPCVIKSNYGSGNNIFIKSKEELLSMTLDKRVDNWNTARHPPHLKERVYESIERKIFVEPFLGENISDYKIYVFGGKAMYIHVDTDRFIGHKRNFFDREWRELPLRLQYPRGNAQITKPASLEEMLDIAERLAAPFDFARVDLYDCKTGPKFGELTFLPGSGMERFDPPEFDVEFGKLWRLSPA